VNENDGRGQGGRCRQEAMRRGEPYLTLRFAHPGRGLPAKGLLATASLGQAVIHYPSPGTVSIKPPTLRNDLAREVIVAQ
jgi:hypothetical protein